MRPSRSQALRTGPRARPPQARVRPPGCSSGNEALEPARTRRGLMSQCSLLFHSPGRWAACRAGLLAPGPTLREQMENTQTRPWTVAAGGREGHGKQTLETAHS